MLDRLVPVAISGLMLLALSGCADKKPDGPPVPLQVNGHTVYFAPNDPIVKQLTRMMCSHTACRDGYSVHLRIPNGPDFTSASPLRSPYSQQGQMFLFAGETLSFEAKEGADGPTELEYVEKVTHPEKTITVRLDQPPTVADGYGMRLTVTNPFDKALKYGAVEVRPGEANDRVAGLCPAAPHGESRKSWPYPLMQVVILNLKFVPTEQAEACAP